MEKDAGLYDNISCPLCKGFLIDTVTLTDCAHFFCRSCFLKHLEKSKSCPTCQIELKNLQTSFQPDHTLQDFVYKYAATTYWKEIRQRSDYIEKRFPTIEEKKLIADWKLIQFSQFLCLKNEKIPITVEYISPNDLLKYSLNGENSTTEIKSKFIRHFRCLSSVKIKHLKKLLQGKFDLPDNYVLQFIDLDSEEILEDDYSFQDLIYIFGWKRENSIIIRFTLSKLCSDEDKPPVLQVEEFIDVNNQNDSPPKLTPEPPILHKMPSLTVNLSTDLFTAGSSKSTSKLPIITKTNDPIPKKKRKISAKKVEKVPIAPNLSSSGLASTSSSSNSPTVSANNLIKTPSPVTMVQSIPSTSMQSPRLSYIEPQRFIQRTPDNICAVPTFGAMNPIYFMNLVAPVNTISMTQPITPISANVGNSIKLSQPLQGQRKGNDIVFQLAQLGQGQNVEKLNQNWTRAYLTP
uniref:RING-type domain-containing protein n=1 Tax=Panagrolaimus sp. JU765 TaxID=591449 RepID=A0AC34R329_9BILA